MSAPSFELSPLCRDPIVNLQTSDFNETLTFSPFISRPYRESNIVTISDSEDEIE